jgi:hypothetical protein
MFSICYLTTKKEIKKKTQTVHKRREALVLPRGPKLQSAELLFSSIHALASIY